jgi:hypothetical protein
MLSSSGISAGVSWMEIALVWGKHAGRLFSLVVTGG